MAFLGSIGKTFERVFTNPVVQVVFPVAAAANLGALALGSKLGQSFSQSNAPAQASAQYTINPGVSYQPQSGYYPQYYAPPSGSYLDPFSQPYNEFGGYNPWDYSTLPQTYYPATPSPVAYSERSSTSWEDLVSLGMGLFL
jgi:hypothetical protein